MVALCLISLTIAWLAFGGIALAVLLPVWLLALAWRFDNHTGSLMLLAILFLLAAAIMVLLIGLMALHR